MRWLIVKNLPQWEQGVALFYPKNLEKGEPIIMSNKFLKKSLRILALLATVSACNQVHATLMGSDGRDYDTGGAVNLAPRNPIIALVSAGGATNPSGIWTLDGAGETYLVAQGTNNTITHTGAINAANKATLLLLGDSSIDFSGTAMTTPSTTGTLATVLLLNAPGHSAVSAGLSYKTVLPTPANLTGNWAFVSENDSSAIDTDATNTAMAAFTMNAKKSCYFGGIRGVANSSYATTFGGSASAVVTGPGTLKLGTAFTTFIPIYTAFTGTLETNSALTLGSTAFPVNLSTNTLVINSGNTVTLGSAAPTIKKLVSGNESAVLSAVTGATVSIAELDLTAYPITLHSPASGIVTYNIAKITEGSDQPLTLNNAGVSLTVKITAGRTDGGIVKAGTIAGISLTQP